MTIIKDIMQSSVSEGYLELILGPMFSGKTTTLLKIYSQCKFCNIPVSVINFEGDTRYCDSSMLSSHDKHMIPCIKGSSIKQIFIDNKEELDKSEVYLINEGQFFTDILEVIDLVENRNKRVYICGLDGDFQKNKIGSLIDLIPHCDKVHKLRALCSECKDGKQALFSYRITDETDQVVIGVDNYKPVCRKCYNDLNKKKEEKHKINN